MCGVMHIVLKGTSDSDMNTHKKNNISSNKNDGLKQKTRTLII